MRTPRRLGTPDIAFLALFAVFTAAIVVWLVAGLLPALARVPAVGDALEGGGPIARRAAAAAATARPGWEVALDYAFSALTLGLGVFLIWRRPEDRVAKLFAAGMLGTGAAYNLQSHAAVNVIPDQADLLHPFVIHAVAGVAYVYALLLFPDGRLVPRWRSRPARVAYVVLTFAAVVGLLRAAGLFAPEPGVGHAVAFVQLFGLMIPAVGLASQAYRSRRPASPEAAQQSRLLLWALTPALVLGIAFVAIRGLTGPGALGAAGFADLEAIAFRAFQPVLALIPIALAVGILRYRLWDIDVVVNRAILYGTLAGFIGAVYVLAVVGVGAAAGSRSRLGGGVALAVTAVVAVAFEPVRVRAQRLANRLVYGRRATPYEVMADFSRRVAATLSVDEVLPQMAEAAARGVGAVRGCARVLLSPGGERSAVWPPGAGEGTFDRTVPVTHKGAIVGEIEVARSPGGPVTAADERLLGDLAAQAGVALEGVRLAAQLRDRLDEISARAVELAASRQRLVSARDDERRRLERQIREEVEPRLVSAAAAAAKAARTVRRWPRRAVGHLDAAAAEVTEALEMLRDLAHGVFPAVLADRGLLPALHAQVRRLDLPTELHIPEQVAGRRFDPHVEAAVYFCCVEALRNVARHGGGSPATVRISAEDGWLSFAVSDAGPGFDPQAARSGSHLAAMADRIEALGGAFQVRSAPGRGALVVGRVPAQPRVAAAHTSASVSGPNADFGR